MWSPNAAVQREQPFTIMWMLKFEAPCSILDNRERAEDMG